MARDLFGDGDAEDAYSRDAVAAADGNLVAFAHDARGFGDRSVDLHGPGIAQLLRDAATQAKAAGFEKEV